MNDWYLQDPTRLNGQPKRTIADYVEQNGILVPRRFDSLAQARASGLPIFIRSEHPWEYNQFSGFFDSFSLDYFEKMTPAVDKLEQIKEAILESRKRGKYNFRGAFLLETYCNLLGENPSGAINGLSFSLWEYLRGIKRVVVADSSIKGRHHIQNSFSSTKQENKWMYDYLVFDNGVFPVKMNHSYNFPSLEDSRQLVDLYENIRNLPRFDKNNCPIIEFLTIDGKNYFLQYHLGREFKEADFKLDRQKKENEQEALLVRGHTPKEGIMGNLTIYYADEGEDYDKWKLPTKEFGAMDTHQNWAFSEIMYPRRQLQVRYTSYKKSLDWELLKFTGGHAKNSQLHRPEISAVYDMGQIASESELERMRDALESGKNQGVEIKLISDGRKAYLERI